MKYVLSLLTCILPIVTFAAPYLETSPHITLKKISERYQTYENDMDVLMKSFQTYFAHHFGDTPLQNIKKERNMYQLGTYAYFSQGRSSKYQDAGFRSFVSMNPELSEEEAEKEYARQQYQKNFQETKDSFFNSLTILPYTPEHIQELTQLFDAENFERIAILLPEYTLTALKNASLEQKYAFFKQQRTPIPLYETAVQTLLSPEKIPNFPEKIRDWNNHLFSISGWESFRQYPPNTPLVTDTHITETYEFTLGDKANFNIQIFPVTDVQLLDRRFYFQKQILFLDTTMDIYNPKITIQPKDMQKLLREGIWDKLYDHEYGSKILLSKLERKHQLAEYSIPIKRQYEDRFGTHSMMDFGENNELEIHDAYFPCNTTLMKNTCYSQSITPYYALQASIPVAGEYLIILEYDTIHPLGQEMQNNYHHDRTILFEEKSIPKTIKKKVSEFQIPQSEK